MADLVKRNPNINFIECILTTCQVASNLGNFCPYIFICNPGTIPLVLMKRKITSEKLEAAASSVRHVHTPSWLTAGISPLDMNMCCFGQPGICNPFLVKQVCVSFIIFHWSTFTENFLRIACFVRSFHLLLLDCTVDRVFCDSTYPPIMYFYQRRLSSHPWLLPWNNTFQSLHICFLPLRSWLFQWMHIAKRKRCYKEKTLLNTST